MPDMNFDCPHCSQNLEAPDSMAGDVIPCPTCERELKVPQPAAPPAAETPPAADTLIKHSTSSLPTAGQSSSPAFAVEESGALSTFAPTPKPEATPPTPMPKLNPNARSGAEPIIMPPEDDQSG